MSDYEIDMPDAPRWATDSAVTLEPAEGKKDTGFVVDEVVPAREWNWYRNLVYQWTQRQIRTAFGSFQLTQDLPVTDAADTNDVTYWPATNMWVVVRNAGSNNIRISKNGHDWYTSTVDLYLSGNKITALANDGSLLVADASGGVGSYTIVTWTSHPVTGLSALTAIGTAYGYSDTVVVTNGSLVRVGSSYSAATWTAPNPSPTPTGSINNIIHRAGTWWYAVSSTGETWDVDNAGSAWNSATAVVSATYGAVTVAPKGLAYNPLSGRLVVLGRVTVSAGVYAYSWWYSDNEGVTWTEANEKPAANVAYVSNPTLKYIGNKTWVAFGSFSYYTEPTNYAISYDDGENWEPGNLIYNGTAFSGDPGLDSFLAVGKNRLLMFNDYGTFTTRTI